jgi:hypothetical protein
MILGSVHELFTQRDILPVDRADPFSLLGPFAGVGQLVVAGLELLELRPVLREALAILRIAGIHVLEDVPADLGGVDLHLVGRASRGLVDVCYVVEGALDRSLTQKYGDAGQEEDQDQEPEA